MKITRPGWVSPTLSEMKNKLITKTLIIKLLLLATVLLFFYSLINRPPDVDDAWLGEHAYWQAKLGFVKSELMNGITFQNIRFLCHHKLLTLQGTLFINIFGFSLYALKFISLIYLIIFLILFYFYAFKKIFTPFEFWLSLLLFLSNTLIFKNSFVFRPEIAVMTLGFISYLFIVKVLSNSKYHYFFVMLSGLFAGLCVSTHLNGIVFPIAGVLLLLWNKKYFQSIIFGLSTIPTILIYFYDFTSKYNLDFWLYQLNNTPSHDRISDLPFGMSYLMNLLNEHMRFFHSPLEISFSVLFIIIFIIAFKHLKTHLNMMRYLFLLVFFIAVLSVHKTSTYMIIYFPYLIILATLSLKYIFTKNNLDTYISSKLYFKKIKYSVCALLLIYLIVNTFLNIQISKEKWTKEENQYLVQTYIKGNTNDYRIIAPMTFIFNEINNFKSIQSELCYSEMQKSDKTIYRKGFLHLTNIYKIDYIILSEHFIKKFKMDSISNIEIAVCNFQVLLKRKDLIILKKLISTTHSQHFLNNSHSRVNSMCAKTMEDRSRVL